MSGTDRLRRFLFEDAPVRGHWVRLGDAWLGAREHQSLQAASMALLGEALAACTLLAGSLKFTGTLTLQLRGGTGALTLLIAQATDALQVRGVAHERVADSDDGPAAGTGFTALTREAQLVVTVERGDAGPWQGIVSLDGASLAQCLESYFANSEQLPTAIVLAADARQAAGMLLQKLPTPQPGGEAEEARIYDLWDEAVLRLRTVQADELLELSAEDLLQRVFAGHTLRLFEGEAVRFACRCDRERVAAVLKSLGHAEVESILAEQGVITVTCEFCQRPYRFDAVDAERLFAPLPGAEDSGALN
jgi:molecular chaperone Hsp33